MTPQWRPLACLAAYAVLLLSITRQQVAASSVFLPGHTGLLSQGSADQEPRQIHIAYGRDDDSIAVSWSTAGPVSASCVRYQAASPVDSQPALTCGQVTRFQDGGTQGYVQVHNMHFGITRAG